MGQLLVSKLSLVVVSLSWIEDFLPIFLTVEASNETEESFEWFEQLINEFYALVFWLIPEQRLSVLIPFSSIGFKRFVQRSSELLLFIGKADLEDLTFCGLSPKSSLGLFFGVIGYPLQLFSDYFQLQVFKEGCWLKEIEEKIGKGLSMVFLSSRFPACSAAEYFRSFLKSLGAHKCAKSLETGRWLPLCEIFFKNCGLLTAILMSLDCWSVFSKFLVETLRLCSWLKLCLIRCWWSKYFKLLGTLTSFFEANHLRISSASLKLGLSQEYFTF